MTCSVRDAQRCFGEILEKVRSGETVVLVENGKDVAEVRAVQEPMATDEGTFRRLQDEGILSPASEKRASLEEVLDELQESWRISPPRPGGLARFLDSRR